MANAYQCDWCKKLMVNKYQAEIMPGRRSITTYSYFALDICTTCGKKFEDFLRQVTLGDEEVEADGT